MPFTICYHCRVLRCSSESCDTSLNAKCAKTCFKHVNETNVTFDFCEMCVTYLMAEFEHQCEPVKRLRIEGETTGDD